MALLVLATLKLRGSIRASAWIGYGALWAVGAMINLSFLGVLPFLAVWALWPVISTPAHAARLAAASALVFLAGITPWTVRNYVVFHELIPLRSNFGLELLLGMREDLPDGVRSLLHPNDNLEEARKYARMGELAYMADKQREALASMREYPVDAALSLMRRAEETWLDLREAPRDAWTAGSSSDRLAILGNALFFTFCFGGVLMALRAQNAAAMPLVMVVMAYPLVFYFTHASLRYRQPMDGIMLVLAIYSAGGLLAPLAARFRATDRAVPMASRMDMDSQREI
jgi:hypothetical protein